MFNTNAFTLRAVTLHPEFKGTVHATMNRIRGRACPAPSVMSPERRAELDRLLNQLQSRDGNAYSRLSPLFKFIAGYTPDPGDVAKMEFPSHIATYVCFAKEGGEQGIMIGMDSSDVFCLKRDGTTFSFTRPTSCDAEVRNMNFRFLEESEVEAFVTSLQQAVR